MNRVIKLSLVSVVIVGMTGCTQPNMTDSQLVKTQATGVGALGGAALGGLIGGKDGALLGAAVGGLAGYAYGSHVADQKSKYARTEDWLNAGIVSAKKVNRQTRSYNSKLSKKIAESKRLVKQYKQGKISKSKLRAQKKIIDRERQTANKMLKDAQKELAGQQRMLKAAKNEGKNSQARHLAEQIRIMKKQNRDLKNQTKTLASLSALTAV